VVAAGGIADGRGVAAALMLGAYGVLMSSRIGATQEALIPPRVVATPGDETIRTSVDDIVRPRIWPEGYTGRLTFVEWIGLIHDLPRAGDVARRIGQEAGARLIKYSAAIETAA
jgi:nitronate monooxygenase